MSKLRTKERDKKVADMWRPDLDAELAAANAAKGTSGGYTNTPQPKKGLSKIELPEKLNEVAPVVMQPKSFYSQFVEMTTPPITAEEQAKRQRAATARQGIQALGNAMSALSNLTFSSMGAPSQTIPNQEVEKTGDAMTSWQERLKAEREKYQAAELGAKTQQWKMEQEERRYADQLKQQGIENTIKLGNLEMSRAKLAHDIDYAKQMLDLRVKELIQNGENAKNAHTRAMKELGIQEQRLGLAKDELKARQDGSYYTGKKTEDWKPVSTHVGDMEIDNSKINGINLAQYAEMLKENGEDELARALASLRGDEKSLEQLRQTIGKALVNPSNTAIVEDMIKKGILRPVGASSNSKPKSLGWGNGNIDLSSSW